ncbi:MAG: effector binding domain-containing protein [Anaerofustis sp.]
MEWLKGLNEAMNYIETHLDDEIDLQKAAQLACCSAFHFQRMFSYLADVPLGEYIRRRKMTKAAFDLKNSNDKVIDVALRYGYDSPTAFNRAFQSIHGIAPSAAREERTVLKAYPPISFRISVKGEAEMNYRIQQKDAFQIIGVKERYPINSEQNFAEIPTFWQKTTQSGIIPQLCGLLNREPYGVLGVCANMDDKEFDYYIAVASNSPTPQGLSECTIPASTWAIFECVGAMPTAIQELQKRIVSEWLPNSDYEYANAPDIEVYFEGDQFAEDYRCEVWLPVIQKAHQ